MAISAAVLAFLQFILIPLLSKPKAPQYLQDADAQEVSQIVVGVLAEYNIRDKWIAKRKGYYEVGVPSRIQLYNLCAEIRARLDASGAQVVKCSEDLRTNKIELTVGRDNKLGEKFVLVQRAIQPTKTGTAAIIIDDFGYAYDNVVKEFILFPKRLTLSIIPGLKESTQVGREAQLAQKEVLIHMPMEPLEEKYSDEGFTILTDQDPGIVRLRIRRACSVLPMSVGINNHQGSKATADAELMRVVMSEIKATGRFFVDSRTNPESVALSVAKSMKLRSGANQVFLDAEDDEEFISGQLKKLAELAASKGKAIAIGHVRKKTLRILKSDLPALEARGIELVFVSQVL